MHPISFHSDEYPFTHRYFPVDRHSMHYIDEGSGSPILFVHGTPSWSFDFRHLIAALRKEYRCIALDHIGFGLSDKPKNYPYTLQQHIRNIEAFTDQQVPAPFTLVVHDFGGPIALDMALRHPEKIRAIIILNSWLWSSASDPEFRKLKKILKSPLLPFLYRYLNFSPRYILPASFGDKKIKRDILRHYTSVFRNAGERYGPLGFARSLLHDQDYFEMQWKKISALSDKPVQFIWGMKDPVIRPHNLEKFMTAFPDAAVTRLPTAGHFPQEEEPEMILIAMKQFLANINMDQK